MRKLTQVLLVVFLLAGLAGSAPGQTDQPALYAILVDNSGSLRSQFNRVMALGNAVLEDVHKHGPISIFSFKGTGDPKDAPPLTVAHTIWNQDHEVLSRYLESLFIEGGQTNLLDAVHSMVNHINAKAEQDKTPNARKVLVLITDGEDRKSKIKEKELLAELQQHQIKVFAIGLVRELKDEMTLGRGNPRSKAVKLLTRIAKETGGRALFPKTNSGDASALVSELFADPK
jgi:Ca-activated chloride channel family protein